MDGHQATPQPPAAKRRRVDAANAALRKPFQSPLLAGRRPRPGADGSPASPLATIGALTPPRVVQPQGGDSNKLLIEQFSPVARSAALSIATLSSNSTPHAARNAPGRNTPFSRRTARPTAGSHPLFSSSTSTSTSTTSGPASLEGQLASLQQDLDAELRAARCELDLVRQAALIEEQSCRAQGVRGAGGLGGGEEGDGRAGKEKIEAEEEQGDGEENKAKPPIEVDADLRMLVAKWRAASRRAAEDLFELIRGRVESMGGAKAWRETKRRALAGGGYGEGFDADDRDGAGRRERRGRKGGGRRRWEEDDNGEGSGRLEAEGEEEEEEEGDAEDKYDMRRDEDDGGMGNRGAGSGEDARREQDKEDDEDGTEFTMAMMLESLNIDPKVVGYDPAEDRWRD